MGIVCKKNSDANFHEFFHGENYIKNFPGKINVNFVK